MESQAKRLALNIAGVGFSIRLPQAGWERPLSERYGSFAGTSAASWEVVLRHDPSLVDTDRPWIRYEGPHTAFRVLAYEGEIDMAARHAAVSTPTERRAPSALDRTLSYILMQVLPREHEAILLHAAGINLDGGGHVFFGASGAGKTTVARLASGEAEVLTDENVVLQVAGRGVDLLSTPFWGTSTPPEMIRRVRKRLPVQALYALVHGPDFRLEPLAPAEAAMALLTTEKVAVERVESASAWLGTVAQIVALAPVYRLELPPSEELWPFLRAHWQNV